MGATKNVENKNSIVKKMKFNILSNVQTKSSNVQRTENNIKGYFLNI